MPRRSVVLIFAGILLSGCDGDGGDPSPTPTPASSPAPVTCPTSITLAIDGAGSDLDAGTSGVNYDTRFNDGDELSLSVSCGANDTSGCGACVLAAASSSTRQRCLDDVSRRCSRDEDCETGRCIALLGAPLPLSAGGIPSCALNEVVAVGPGSWDPVLGDLALPFHLRWTFFTGLDADMACPICSGTGLGAHGQCEGGPHGGAPCTVDGSNGIFGNTSYDCPPHPSAFLTIFELPALLTTGTSSLVPDQTCVGEPFSGLPCLCPGQTTANDCIDGLCEEVADGDGVCTRGPMDGLCEIEFFRGCRGDDDCPRPGDRCTSRPRECSSPATGEEGDVEPLMRVGHASPDAPVLVSTFCVPPTSASAFNQGLGLPAPAALRLPVRIR